MYKIFALPVLSVAIFLYSPINHHARGGDIAAEETAQLKQSLEDKAAALISSPAGVFDVEIVDGQIVRLKIKGEGDVLTSMRASRADRYAREKANRDARAAFAKFLSENVIFSEAGAEGIAIEEKSGGETSDVLEASAKLYSGNSAAMLKGLIVLMDRIEGEGERRTCTVVLGWSRKLVNAANMARADMATTKRDDAPPAKTNAVPEMIKAPVGNVETVTRVGNLDNF